MPDLSASVDIPNRALFKASEVCELLGVQAYVLRSWESEFPALGVAKSAGAPRVYRRRDVELVRRIKHMLLVDGLTLAGARRRLDEEATPVAADAPAIDELIGRNARERLTEVKRGLRSILELLAGRAEERPRAERPRAAVPRQGSLLGSPALHTIRGSRPKPAQGRSKAHASKRPAPGRRKRSA